MKNVCTISPVSNRCLLPRRIFMSEESWHYGHVQWRTTVVQRWRSSASRRFLCNGWPVISFIWSSQRDGERPLGLLPSTFSCTISFSKLSWFLRVMWPKYWRTRLRHIVESRSVMLSSLRIDRFVFLAVQGMPSIRLRCIIVQIRRIDIWDTIYYKICYSCMP